MDNMDMVSIKSEPKIDEIEIKSEINEVKLENFEISINELDTEFEKFHKEDEKLNSGKTVLENSTTAYKCDMCNKIFIEFPEYKQHKKQHFIEKRRCNICNIVCQSVSKLQVHLNGHLGLKPYQCLECSKKFTCKYQLKLHGRCHTDELRYKCKKCEKAFKHLGSLRSHNLVHQEKIKEFICKVAKTSVYSFILSFFMKIFVIIADLFGRL